MLHPIGRFHREWEVDESQALLELVVDLFLTIRGFCYASAWMEKYIAATAKTAKVKRVVSCHQFYEVRGMH